MSCQGSFGVLVFPYCLLWNWDESERVEGLSGTGGCIISSMFIVSKIWRISPHVQETSLCWLPRAQTPVVGGAATHLEAKLAWNFFCSPT